MTICVACLMPMRPFDLPEEANQGIMGDFVFDLGKDKLDRAFRVQG